MGSQKAAGGRTLPALSGLWNGEVEPLRLRAPGGQRRGVSGAARGCVGRRRAAAGRPRPARVRPVGRLSPARRRRPRPLVSRRHGPARGTAYGMTERTGRGAAGGAAGRLRRLLPDGGGAGAGAAGERAWSPATSSSTPSPGSRAPARRRASARTSARSTRACRRTACSRIVTPPRSSRSWACR